jgi:type II secretory pathway pseudopilin PulG
MSKLKALFKKNFFKKSPMFPAGSRLSSESGFALASLMIVAALMLIAMAAAMPDLKTQSRREKELELQFRAMQYARAIQAYNRKFPNQWPTSVDALMNTNNVRFLRKKWKDPMTKDGDWRFIHLGPNNVVIDSTATFTAPNVQSVTGTSRPAGVSSASVAPQPGTAGSSGPAGFSLSSGMTSSTTGGVFSTTQLSNLPIVGVASKSTKESIMSCSGFNHYNEWEFIALPQGRYAGTGCYLGMPISMIVPFGAVPGQIPSGANPFAPAGQGLPGQASPRPGTTPPANPFGGLSTTPQGGLPPR